MELHIFPDRFIIEYTPAWVAIMLLSGLVFFFISKSLRQYYKKNYKYSFLPGVIFIISFVFLIGGINLFVYKIVFNKDGLIVFNIHNFNKSINWQSIDKVHYLERQNIEIIYTDEEPLQDKIVLNLEDLLYESMDKVKVLFRLKLRLHHKPLPEL